MIALSIALSVALVVAGCLVAWRWLLAHLAAGRLLKTRDIDAELVKVRALDEAVQRLGDRLQKVEVRTAGR